MMPRIGDACRLITVVLLALLCALLAEKTGLGADSDTQPAAARRDAQGDPLPSQALLRLGSLRFRIPQRVTSIWTLACSRDGKLLFSCNFDGTLQAWDPQTGKAVGPAPALPDGRAPRHCWRVSPDGSRVAERTPAGLEVWQREPRKQLCVIADPLIQDPNQVAFSADSTLIAVPDTAENLLVVDLATTLIRARLTGHKSVKALALSGWLHPGIRYRYPSQ